MKKLYRLIFILFFFLIFVTHALAQGKRANNWYFGSHAGLSFNFGNPPPGVLYDGMTALGYSYGSGVASMSDDEGNLLFYGDGGRIWNRNHVPMQNGFYIGELTEQGAIVVPDPGNPNLYYYFNFEFSGQSAKIHFQYSVIDMQLDNGLGGIPDDKRCIRLLNYTYSHLSAVTHGDGDNVWVVVHTQGDNAYYSYKVTALGIEQPVISYVGSVFPSTSCSGYLKISPDGKKIAAVVYDNVKFCEILDFDTQTGEVSDNNLVHITEPASQALEFSPDNSFLYLKGYFLFKQYDLNAGTPQEIINSAISITTEFIDQGAMQLGPDGKIYCATDQNYVGIIHNPNTRGVDCYFEKRGIYVGDNRSLGWGLPSFIQSYLNDPQYTTSMHCFGQPTQFNIVNTNGIDSVKWKFWDWGNFPDDTSTFFSPQYTFSAAGTYYPELTVWSGNMKKIVKDTVVIYPVPSPDLGSDTLFCPNEPIQLTLDAGPGGHYRWNNGFPTTDSTFIVTDIGTFTVMVNSHGCIGTDTINVARYADIQTPDVNKQDDHCSQLLGSLTVIPQTGTPDDYSYSINGTDYYDNGGVFNNLAAGVYTITIINQSGCISEVVFDTIQDIAPPDINCIATAETGNIQNGTITIISSGINLIYEIEGLPSQTANLFTGLSEGQYYVTVTDAFGCFSKDTVLIENLQGDYLEALAGGDRECLYKPAHSDIQIARVNNMSEFKATLYFNDNILVCTNFNANDADFPGISAQLFNSPKRIEIEWNGTYPVTTILDTLTLGTMIFETLNHGDANINWESNSSVTHFLDLAGDTIQPVLIPGTIKVHQLPQIMIDQPLPICENTNFILAPQVSGGTDPFNYNWITPKNNSIHSEQLELINAKTDDSGKYLITVSDNFHCTATAEINLVILPLPKANFPTNNDTINFEQTYLLEATQGYASYEWNTGDTTYYINVTQEGEYSVMMRTEEGCAAVENVYMLTGMAHILIPNAFTPNGDGINDTFKPVINTELVRQFSMIIYNKWGERIYETTNATSGWHGENGMPGVYVWVINYENRVGKRELIKGSVALVR